MVVAIVENAGHGGDVAAPVVGSIIEAYMNKKLGPADAIATRDGGTP